MTPRIARLAMQVARILLGVMLLGMVALNVMNAVGRYAIGAVFVGTDEVLVYAMAWLVMIGMLVVTAERSHISLDFAANRLGRHAGVALSLLQHVVVTAVCTYAAIQSLIFVLRISAIGQTSMALGMPMLIPHSALIVGFAGTALIAALLVVGDVAELGAMRGGSGKTRR